MQLRIPVVDINHKPLMPAKPSRVRHWLEQGKAVKRWSDTGLFYVQLTFETSENVQPISVGIDPGKLYSGIAVQSAKFTLFAAHLILPFKTVKDRMEQRAMMRRGRRGRRINRKVAFKLRAHRQKRFDNRKGHKLPPSIRANRQLELRVVTELCKVFPVSCIVYEYVKANGSKSFSPVMVGQKWMIAELSKLASTDTRFGYETAQIRNQLGLVKDRQNKGKATPETHAVDGIALAASQFIGYESFHSNRNHGHEWQGSVDVTPSPFFVIRRPPISRRQLHLMVPAKSGLRRKYGGSVTRHGFRKGDFVHTEKFGFCRVCGDTASQIAIANSSWKRLGYSSPRKVDLIQRSTGLIVQGE